MRTLSISWEAEMMNVNSENSLLSLGPTSVVPEHRKAIVMGADSEMLPGGASSVLEGL